MNIRYFIEMAFNGSNYHGWQIQKNAITVQQVMNEACSLILRTPVKLTGCGRTDSGVHARRFFAHFDTGLVFPEKERNDLVFKINNYLGDDIALNDLFPVRPGIHARFSATARTYCYVINRCKDPFSSGLACYLYGDLDRDLIDRGAEFLLSVSDFTSFSKVNSDTGTNICKVTRAHWTESGHQLVFIITANRFLRNMVRAIVGTLLDLGTGKISFDDFRQIVSAKNRSDAGESVPACGLYLEEVVYPDGIRLLQ